VPALVDHLVRLGGVATRGELLQVASRVTLDRALADGSIHRPRRGRYVLPQADESRRVAHEVSGVVALRSAALTYGWKVRTLPQRPEVIVPRDRKVRADSRARAVLRRADLKPHEVQQGVTSPLRTVIDCARHLPFEEALSVADSAVRSGVLRSSDLTGAARAAQGAGRARVVRVLTNANRKAANPFESSLRAIALDVAGLRVVPQVGVIVAGGTRVAPDLVDVDLGLVLEADSHEFHTGRQRLASDCWRYDELVLAGWRLFRFTWEQVMFEQAWVRSVLERAVALVAAQTHKPVSGARGRA
jgi:very-short-patch-repair endonuclease